MATVFGDWLKAQRKKNGMTQDQLAETAGLTKAQISRLESGLQGTKRATAVRLAEALGSDPQVAFRALMGDTPSLNPLPEPTRELSDEEWELVELYRGVSPERRELYKKLMENAVEIFDKEPDPETVPLVD